MVTSMAAFTGDVFTRDVARVGPAFLTALRTVPVVVRPKIIRLMVAAGVRLVPATGSVGIGLVHESPHTSFCDPTLDE